MGIREWSRRKAVRHRCAKHRRSPRTGEVESINFGGDDVIRHDWVSVPFHLIEIISRLCCLVHLRIWNGTKERSTDTAALASSSWAYWPLASRDLQHSPASAF